MGNSSLLDQDPWVIAAPPSLDQDPGKVIDPAREI
jgi:hypothetical protein